MTQKRHPIIRIWILAAALLALFCVSFVLGRYDVPVSQVVRILLHGMGLPMEQTWTDPMATAILQIRLPRILLAALVGCALSAAGTAYQSAFQNPMAAPDILGASSGACFGATLAILLNASDALVTASAFLASLFTVVLVYLISCRAKGNRIVNLLLSGIMVSSLFSAGISYVKLVADPSSKLPEITYWLMGSLSGSREEDVLFVLWPVLVGVLPLLALRWRINLLTLGEEEAHAMGVHTGRLRLTVILSATVLTAASVAVAGMIGWIGLVIPHLSRRLVGNDCRYLFPCSMVFGAVFLVLVDNISRNLLPVEIPIGILMALVGAPFFLYLMTKRGSGT